MRKLKELYYEVSIGISNIIYYLPLIWKDRSWDYTYNYRFLKVKLQKQREDILKYSNHINATRDAKQIQVCINLLDRLENKEYDDSLFDSRGGMQPLYYKVKSGINPMNIRIRNMVDTYKHQDIDLLATYLKKYGGGWWY